MSKDDKADEATVITEDDPTVAAETKVAKVDEAAEAKKAGDEAEAEDVVKAEEPEAESATADDDSGTADAEPAAADEAEDSDEAEAASDTPKRRIDWSRVVAFGLLPALALVLALGAGYLKWMDDSNRDGVISANPSGPLSLAESSVQAAKDSTITLLSYQPDTVEEQLGAARDLLAGEFRDSYIALTTDVVIPGAKEKQIAAVASVPAAASVSATPTEAVVLVFVNQTVSVGQDPPTDTASSVRVTLEKAGDRWLITKFDPV